MADNLKLLSEQLEIKPGRVDAENGILYDCLLLGPNSRNQVVYPTETREKALPLFKTAKINLGHPSVPSGSEKDRLRAMAQPVHPTSRYGKVLDARNTPEGIRGDVRVGKSHEFTKMLMEAAQDMPELFGFSPLMLGLMAPQRDSEGREVCLEIRKLRSIDLVTDPGTTRGLWEEEALPEVELVEEAAPEVEEEVPPQEEEALRQSILAEIQAFLDEEQAADETASRVGKHLKHHEKMYGTDKGKEDAPPDGKEAAQEEEVRWDFSTRKKEEKVLSEQVTGEEKPAKPTVVVKKPKSGMSTPLPTPATGNGRQEADWGKFLRS